MADILQPWASNFQITIDGLDLGQALDGLRCREQSWSNTAVYLRDGSAPIYTVCEECSDPQEAQRIADHYQRIMTGIEWQIDKQGGW